jgi:predicted nucleic acid-binding protein
LTQLAFVRIVSNPAFSPDALTPADALALLARNVAHPAHEFWPDSLALTEALSAGATWLQGYRQVADAYLLGMAASRRAVLASFDRGLRSLIGPEEAGHVEIVPVTGGRRRS